jgi:hypothetical protein
VLSRRAHLPIDTTTTEQRLFGGVDDRVDLEHGDVALPDSHLVVELLVDRVEHARVALVDRLLVIPLLLQLLLRRQARLVLALPLFALLRVRPSQQHLASLALTRRFFRSLDVSSLDSLSTSLFLSLSGFFAFLRSSSSILAICALTAAISARATASSSSTADNLAFASALLRSSTFFLAASQITLISHCT